MSDFLEKMIGGCLLGVAFYLFLLGIGIILKTIANLWSLCS